MKPRLLPFYLFLIFSFLLLFGRIFQLTVVQGERHRQLSEGQRVRLKKLPAPRGIIFDRNGKPLVRNVPVYKRCSQATSHCSLITREEAIELGVQGKDAELEIGVGRQYLYSEAMAHLLGYLGEVSPDEISVPSENFSDFCDSGKHSGYKLGDLVGRTGIEQQYDCLLRGKDGGELLEVDTHGVTVRKIGQREPVIGHDLTLSIDSDLQKVAFQALAGRRGAVVASHPQTGEILVLVSSPSFNPQDPSLVLTDPEEPLFNRAISGAYPPGSTYKIVTAAAGLEEGKINSQTEIEDPGEIVIGQYRYANWYFTQYGKTEGVIDLVRAIKRSTDTFFYKVGEFVGATKLVEWGKAFGLGRVLGIDIPGEISGFLPDPTKGDWFLGNTYHLAIGQGNLGLTPLQVNTMTSTIASGGKLCQPKLLQSPTTDSQALNCQDLKLRPETIKLISEGMQEACSPGGTAFPLFDFSPQVACKTGTAEFGDPKGRTHAWLTAFVLPDEALAKAGAGPIVVTALVEAGGEGSSIAAPIVKKVLEEYFHRD